MPPERELKIVSNGHGIIEGAALKEETYPFPYFHQLLFLEFGGIASEYEELSLVRIEQSHDAFDEDRFAGSGLPEYDEVFPLVDHQVNVLENTVIPERFLEMFHCNDRAVLRRILFTCYCPWVRWHAFHGAIQY